MAEQTTILIVEDDEVILSSLADILRVAGYSLLMATNGVKGLHVMQHHVPDLILADIMMPEMDGYEFYAAVRANPDWMAIPFIFLTAKGEQKDVQYGYRLGADHYLTKPFEPEDLLVAIEARLKRTAEIQAATRDNAERTRTWLLTVIGQALHAPLNRLYGHVGMLEDGHQLMTSDVVGRMLRGTRTETEQLLKRVEDLMLFAYVDSGMAQIEIERQCQKTILSHLIRNTIRILAPKAEEKGIAFTYPLDDDLAVMGLPFHIEDVLKRLIDNAITFGKEGGHIWVRLEERDGFAVVSVQDNGVGIELTQQQELSRLFERNDRARLPQSNMGLGLIIARSLIELHGGTIQVESQPGEGSVFTFTLPLGGRDTG